MYSNFNCNSDYLTQKQNTPIGPGCHGIHMCVDSTVGITYLLAIIDNRAHPIDGPLPLRSCLETIFLTPSIPLFTSYSTHPILSPYLTSTFIITEISLSYIFFPSPHLSFFFACLVYSIIFQFAILLLLYSFLFISFLRSVYLLSFFIVRSAFHS